MRARICLALLVGLLAFLPQAGGASEASVAASASCTPFVPGQPCVVSQDGTLAVVCGGSCDLVLKGTGSAVDAYPVKQVITTMRIASSMGTVTSGCIGIGLGTTRCDVDAHYPFVTPSGSCDSITVSTSYARATFVHKSVSRVFSVCRLAGGEITVAPAA